MVWRGIFPIVFLIPFLGVACGDDSETPGPTAGSGGSAAGKGGKAGAGRGGSAGAGAGGTAGRGGAGGSAGDDIPGGFAGEPGSVSGFGGVGGEGGDDGIGGQGGANSCACDGDQCSLPIAEFCPFSREVECPIDLERARHPRAICEFDATESTYSECAAGRSVFEWQEGFENNYRLVFDGEGSPVYGRAAGYVGAQCDGAAGAGALLVVEAGREVNVNNCRSCDFCAALENGSGGDGAGGNGSAGEGSGGAGSLPPCAIDENGRISLPDE
jgi:hypothetical protein